MKNRTEVTLNHRGILVLVGFIAALLFALGFMSSMKATKVEASSLTAEDVEMIQSIKNIDGILNPMTEHDMTFYKDKDGNLVITIKMENN